MPRVSPIQESFARGFIGQRIRGRVTSDAYGEGLAECNNWYPLVQGPIRMREGSKYIEAVDSNNWTSGMVGVEGIRSFTFQGGLDNDKIIEIGVSDLIIRDSINGAQLIAGNTGNLIPDPSFSTGLPGSTWSNNLDKYVFNNDPGRYEFQGFDLGVSCCVGFGFPPIPTSVATIKAKTQSAPGPNGFHGAALENDTTVPINVPAGSELLINTISFTYQVPSYSIPLPGTATIEPLPWSDPFLRVSVGTTKGASDVFTTDITMAVANQDVPVSVPFTPGAGNNTLYISIGLVWTGANPTVPDIGGFEDDGEGIYVIVKDLDWTAPLAGGSQAPVEFPSPWTSEQLECLQYTMDPGEQVAFFMHPEVETYRLRLDAGEWAFEAISAIILPDPFVAPSPNTWITGNFPGAGIFHEGRLWLGGSPNEPSTLWASRSGDYVDFNGAAPAAKDDPLLFPLSSAGTIQSLTSRKELVINTDISEVVGTSVQGVIAFDDFSFPKQTDWGSNCIQPIVVGRDMIYTSNSRKRMRTFNDEGGTNYGWDGDELSLLAQEIFSAPVRRMVYLDEPGYQACFLLADGTMGMATFFYPEKVIGWWRYTTAYNGDRASGDINQPGLPNQSMNAAQTVNQIMDITKVNTSEGAKLWMVINRIGFPGTLVPGHELLGFETGLIPALDSYAIRPIDTVSGTVSDIDELTDQSVNCIVEREDPATGIRSYTVHPNISVIAGVSSPLQSWAVQAGNVAHVGLFYDNDFKLLPVKGVANRGTSQVTKRRWNKVYARLNNSAIPLINGEPPKDRTPISPMGTGEPIITNDVEYSELGSDQGELTISQDRPLISEVLALFGKVTSTEI